jgi:hypothetical protein
MYHKERFVSKQANYNYISNSIISLSISTYSSFYVEFKLSIVSFGHSLFGICQNTGIRLNKLKY